MVISAVGCMFAVGLHIYALITYNMGVVSESVLAENQYIASFILIPAVTGIQRGTAAWILQEGTGITEPIDGIVP